MSQCLYQCEMNSSRQILAKKNTHGAGPWHPYSYGSYVIPPLWHICQAQLQLQLQLRGNVKKKHSIFKDIVQIGGRDVNPISRKWKEMIFWQKLEREGVTKHIVKNRSTLFCMIYYSIWPNQGTLCHSDFTPDPQKVIRMIENVNSKPKMSWFLSKILGEGGRSTWLTLCQK